MPRSGPTGNPTGGPKGTANGAPYHNPLRHVTNLTPERVDQGVDYSGNGPVYALGPGKVVRADAAGSGWPGGGFIAYQLTEGPDAGHYVYVAENVTPNVQVGDNVNWTTQVGTMHGGIETGWAAPPPNLGQALAYVSGQACQGSDPGCRPTPLGDNFNNLMVSLGAPAGTGGDASAGGGFVNASSNPDCLIAFPGLQVAGPLGIGNANLGGGCLLSKSQARAIAGASLLMIGGVGAFLGIALATRREQTKIAANLGVPGVSSPPESRTEKKGDQARQEQAAKRAARVTEGSKTGPAARSESPGNPVANRTGRTQQGTRTPPRTGGRTQQGSQRKAPPKKKSAAKKSTTSKKST